MKQTYPHQWEEITHRERVKLRQKGVSYPYETTQVVKETFTTFEGTFAVEIDVERIAKMLIGKAAHGKSGKSAYLHGLCKAKRLTKTAKGTARVKEYPVNLERFEIISEEASQLGK